MSLNRAPTLKSSPVKVGITLGDPAGIGPAIVLKALGRLKNSADFTVIGSGFALQKASGSKKPALYSSRLIDLDNVEKKNFKFGRLSAQGGKASIEYIDEALRLLKENKLDCLVTCPISKEAVNLAGYKISGHTGYLAEKSGCPDLVMMLLNGCLKFSLLTQHIALKKVAPSLNPQGIQKNIRITTQGLRKFFGIKRPRLAVCGLNPHASDNGVMGTEESKVIAPALKRLENELKNVCISGPLSADAAIYKAYKGKFDCVVAMYHDQALIPLKLSGFESGVNLTLGLPFARTSPLHGTAFDIASNPKLANPGSLICAIKLAVKCTQNLRKA